MVPESKLESLVKRLEVAVAKLERGGGGVPSDAGDCAAEVVSSPAYLDYCAWVDDSIAAFLKLSTEIGEDVETMGKLFADAIEAQKQFIMKASKHSKPADADLQKILEPQVKAITAVTEFRDASRRSKFFNHLSSVSEGIPALSWIMVSPTPGPHVKDMKDAAMFYTNRVLKDYRGKDDKHVEWTKKLLQALNALQAYIKQHHTTGLVWNMKGSPAKVGGSKPPVAPKPRAAPGPPPPAGPGPPPPPAGPPSGPPAGSISSGPAPLDTGALFASINKGGSVTTGLKKVTSDMQTHKNTKLRATSKVPSNMNPTPKGYSKPEEKKVEKAKPKFGTIAKKEPLLELDGKKWKVEYQEGNSGITIDGNMKQTIYIFKCTNSTVTVSGKVSSITMDSCKKCAVVFDSAVAALEVINCQSVKSQVTGTVPIINVDKTDGFQMYLSPASISAEIVTAKVSEINIMIPTDEGDYMEKAVVEQFRTVWDSKKKVMITEPVEVTA